MDTKTISIVFHVEATLDNDLWESWLFDAQLISELLGYKSTHFGFTTSKNKSGKIKEINNASKKIGQAIEEGQRIKHISIFSLPPNFESASFDYNVMVVRSIKYVTVIMKAQDYSEVTRLKITNILNKYIHKCDGEIFEMLKSEFPLSYSAKANNAQYYKTLNIIKAFRVD